MGYCMQLRDSDFRIKKSNFAPALAAIKDLAGKETIHDSSGTHFSWVDTNRFLSAETLEDALEAWRWEVSLDKSGDIKYIYFIGEKSGDDEMLFKAIAPFVESDCYIEMQGEDGAMWRWVFSDGKMQERYARVSWE